MSTEKLRCALEAEEKLRTALEDVTRVLGAQADQPADGLVLKCHGEGFCHKAFRNPHNGPRLLKDTALHIDLEVPVTWETLALLLQRGVKEMQKVISQELEQYHRRGGYPDTVTGE